MDTPFTFLRASWQNKHQSHKVLSTLLRRKTTSRRLWICSARLRKSPAEHRWVFSLTSFETAHDVRARYRYRQLPPSSWSCSSSACSFLSESRCQLVQFPLVSVRLVALAMIHSTRHGEVSTVIAAEGKSCGPCGGQRHEEAISSSFRYTNVSGSESDIDLSSALWHRHEFQSSLANLAGRTEAARVPLCISQSSTRSHKTFTWNTERPRRYIHFVYVVMVTTGPQRNRLVLRLVPGLSLPTNTARLRRSLSTQKITSCLV